MLRLYSSGCWFVPTVRYYFNSNNVRLLQNTSFQVKTHNQNEWSVPTLKKSILVSYKILIFRLFVDCINRKSPALNIKNKTKMHLRMPNNDFDKLYKTLQYSAEIKSENKSIFVFFFNSTNRNKTNHPISSNSHNFHFVSFCLYLSHNLQLCLATPYPVSLKLNKYKVGNNEERQRYNCCRENIFKTFEIRRMFLESKSPHMIDIKRVITFTSTLLR